MGAAGEDDVFPPEVGFVFVQKVAPLALWVFFGEVLDELKGALFDGVGFRDGDFIGVVLTGSGFEADVSTAVLADGAILAANRKPFVGVVDADGVKALFVEDAEEVFVVTHEPDDEFTAWSDAGIDTGILDIGGLS